MQDARDGDSIESSHTRAIAGLALVALELRRKSNYLSGPRLGMWNLRSGPGLHGVMFTFELSNIVPFLLLLSSLALVECMHLS